MISRATLLLVATLGGVVACTGDIPERRYEQNAKVVTASPVSLIVYEHMGRYLVTDYRYCKLISHEVDNYRGRVGVWISGPNGTPVRYWYPIRLRADDVRYAKVTLPRICTDHHWARDRERRRQQRIREIRESTIVVYGRVRYTKKPFQ